MWIPNAALNCCPGCSASLRGTNYSFCCPLVFTMWKRQLRKSAAIKAPSCHGDPFGAFPRLPPSPAGFCCTVNLSAYQKSHPEFGEKLSGKYVCVACPARRGPCTVQDFSIMWLLCDSSSCLAMHLSMVSCTPA